MARARRKKNREKRRETTGLLLLASSFPRAREIKKAGRRCRKKTHPEEKRGLDGVFFPGIRFLLFLVLYLPRAKGKEGEEEGEDDSRLEKEKNHMAAVRLTVLR